MRVYAVYNEGKEIYRGVLREVINRFGLNKDDIHRAMYAKRNGKRAMILHKYDIDIVGEWHKEKPIKEKEYEPQTPYEIAVWALKRYGNTSVDFDPYPKLLPELLLNDGLDCSAVEKKEYPSRKVTRRVKPKVHWYVEVVRAIKGSESIQESA